MEGAVQDSLWGKLYFQVCSPERPRQLPGPASLAAARTSGTPEKLLLLLLLLLAAAAAAPVPTAAVTAAAASAASNQSKDDPGSTAGARHQTPEVQQGR